MSSQAPIYRETLTVPWYWWAVGAGFALSIFLAALRFFSPAVGLAAGVVTMLVIGLGLLAYGRTVVQVDAEGLHVGGALLAWPWLGTATALDRDGARERMGPGADARAWLLLRPYLVECVEVGVDDPDDTHPYWLVGSRHPQRLAAAIQQARPSAAQDGERARDRD
ncbi:MAG TPA: DUF3093 domain-containing protein [Candidatus Avipropionibacterium avicola]|uniref:DUF3093 domain-containing protein n=1 Tax=Candidatus Avipropionibacterium avicola TaxID=2840701 RepID=A0A9D1GZ32_9ACTN|nr:DUF3093 domain-containing protein [Candidatus Avipropionibacterium avicola]